MNASILKHLDELGIKNTKEIYHNLSYEELFKHETDSNLQKLERGVLTKTGSVAVDTGIFTGRSPKDKYIVFDANTKKNVWWKSPKHKISDNNPISIEIWEDLKKISAKQLSGKKLYVQDGFAGANENTRMKIRVITEIAWIAHFVKNMFIRPNEEELVDFMPDFTMLNASKTVNKNWELHDLHSDVFIAFNLSKSLSLIGGTYYGGEIKKGIFSIMNYYLPLQNIASMHCSANMSKDGKTALFFGLSGTGKTTLSTEPSRYLIGDDEHGWDNEGIFNLEGGCYAKCINLDEESEPDIYNAIKKDALLENIVYDKEGNVDFRDASKTENTRVSYPLYHINNIVKPMSKGEHPKKIIFLTADAFGILPPVSKLTKAQALYYFLSGYTSKLAGTERGIKEPIPTFSPCFGAAFLFLHPMVYANILADKIEKHNVSVYLVNTGWVGGDYIRGNRIDLKSTRNIIKAIYNGSIDKCRYVELPTFGLRIPTKVTGVDSKILNPRKSWKYLARYKKQAASLAQKFIKNFQNFTDSEEAKKLIASGPKDIYMKQFYEYYTDKIVDSEKEHQNEIQRLKEQIFFLQESYKEFISFNSLNTVYKQSKIYRYLPIVSYFNTADKKTILSCNEAMKSLLQTIEYVPHSNYEADNNYNNFISISKEPFSKRWEEEILKEFFLHTINLTKIQTGSINTALKNLQKTAKGVDEVMLKVGPYIFLKAPIKLDKDYWLQRELSLAKQIYFDRNPNLLTDMKFIIKDLGFIN